VTKLGFLDLFAGCGGLSLGLEQAGLEPVASVELSPMAAETHFKNFHLRGKEWDQALWDEILTMSFFEQLEHGTVVGSVVDLFEDSKALKRLKEMKIDVIAGGPPCQGFSMAGRRNPNDERNLLPNTFLNFVDYLNPKAVVIENVVGINRAFTARGGLEAPFKQLQLALQECGPKGYLVQPVEVNAWTFGVPQNRPRMMLIGIRSDLPIAKEISKTEAISTTPWRSDKAFQRFLDGEDPSNGLRLVPSVGSRVKNSHPKQCFTVLDALFDLNDKGYKPKINYNDSKTKRFAKMMRGKQKQDTKTLSNHVLRKHTERVTQRFHLYHFFAKNNLPTRVLSIPSSAKNKPSAKKEIAAHLGEYAQSLPDLPFATETDKNLVDVVMRLGTRKHSQRVIDAQKPAPTVVTLPDDYIHPLKPRIMTVRELARFQSFPDWFEFRSKETTGSDRRKIEVPQYTQVGNAVPPLMAQAIGELLIETLENRTQKE